jgi:hypothetical protein
MRRSLLTAFLVFLATSPAIVGAAPTPESQWAMGQAMVSTFPVFHDLHQASRNLGEMWPALSLTEKVAFDHLHEAASDSYAAFSEARDMGILLSNMKCKQDYDTVLKYFDESTSAADKLAEASLGQINQSLVQFSQPAVVAEATKIRDLVIELRRRFSPYVGDR